MYLGRPVEHGPTEGVFERPLHPYTKALLASRPRVEVGAKAPRPLLTGELPSPLNPPPGCAFHRRCPHAQPRCAADRPEPRLVLGRPVACHYAEEIASG